MSSDSPYVYSQNDSSCIDCAYNGGICFDDAGFYICEHSVTHISGATETEQYAINVITGEEVASYTGSGICSISILAACDGGEFICGAKGACYSGLGWPIDFSCSSCDCNNTGCIDPCGCIDTDGDGVNDGCDPCPYDYYDTCVNPPPDDPPPDDPPPNDPPPNDPPPVDPCDDPLYVGHLNDTDGDGCVDCEDEYPENERLGCGQCENDIDCDGCPDDDDDEPNNPEVTSKKCDPECPDISERFTMLLDKFNQRLGWDFTVGDNPEPYEYCMFLQGLGDNSFTLCIDFLNMEIYESSAGNHIRYGAASTVLLTMANTIYYAFLAVMWWRFIPRFFKIFRSL